jgi:hypothetical protein
LAGNADWRNLEIGMDSFLGKVIRLIAVIVMAGAATFAQEKEKPAISATTTTIKQLSADLFQIGEVQINKKTRAITFPGRLNMREGLLEYLLVSTEGKKHESLLLTEAEPYHIHTAMLLLGAKGAPMTTAEQRTASTNVTGDAISINVEWVDKDGKKSMPAEDLIFNIGTKSEMTRGPWTYNGSWMFEGTFIAQRERSVVAIIHDHDSLVNNPRPGRENDELWQARMELVPEVGTPVQVSFILSPAKNATMK